MEVGKNMTESPVCGGKGITVGIMPSLAEALSRAQGAMSGAKKDKNNLFFKSKYADLTAVLDAIVPVFNEHGLVMTQSLEEGGLRTTVLHTSGQSLTSVTPVIVDKGGPQAFGSGVTYMRRYMAQAVAGIAADDDDDGNAATKANKENW